MKRKIGLFVLALALTATLVACGNKNASVDPTAPAVAPTDQAEPNNTMLPRTGNSIVGNADSALRDARNAAADTARKFGNAYDWNGGTAAEGYSGYPWTATNGGAADPGTYYYN